MAVAALIRQTQTVVYEPKKQLDEITVDDGVLDKKSSLIA